MSTDRARGEFGEPTLTLRPRVAYLLLLGLFTLGLYYFWWQRTHYVVTDRGVLLAKGILSRKEEFVPKEKLVGVDAKIQSRPLDWTRLFFSGVLVNTGYGTAAEFNFLARKDAIAFRDAARALLP
jgi:uncharacterized membrane protein YdbT with pleckstrin-like domain